MVGGSKTWESILQQIQMIKTVICIPHKRLNDAATRCILRPV